MLTIMCGLPGSGKSTHLKTQSGSVVLCPDDFRQVLTGQVFYAPAEDSVWSHVKTAARVLVRKNHVIIDGTHLTVGSRAQWVRIAEECGVKIDCHWMNISNKTALDRNSKRTEGRVPDVVMDRMADSYVPPDQTEGFWRVLQIAE